MNDDDLNMLKDMVGPNSVHTSGADRAPYEAAARYGTGQSAAVVRPSTLDQLSAVVGFAVNRGIRIQPQSGNTGLVKGSVPDETGRALIVSLDRLRAPLAIDAENRTVEAAGGMRLSEVNDASAAHDLCLPIDLGADPMVGGMVSTNTGGARFIRYGGMRSRVLALTVVLPDPQGTVLRLGTGLRKDNSQMDLKQLFVGSSGALGIVASATLELARRPCQTTAALIVPQSPDAAVPLLRLAEERLGDFLSAFEGMSKEALSAAFAHVPGLRNPFAGGSVPEYAVLIELSTVLPTDLLDLEALLQDALMEICDRDNSPVVDALFGDQIQLWRVRHALSEGLRALGSVHGFDLSFHRSHVFAFREAARAMVQERYPECRVCDFGHIGDGGLHFNIVAPPGWPISHGAQLHDDVVRMAVEQFGGSFSGEHGIGRANQHDYDQFTPQPIQDYSGRVTDAFTTVQVGGARFGLPQSFISLS